MQCIHECMIAIIRFSYEENYQKLNVFSASAGGCKQLEELFLSGCENVSKKGLRSMMRHLHGLRTLTLRGCHKLNDTEGYRLTLLLPFSVSITISLFIE